MALDYAYCRDIVEFVLLGRHLGWDSVLAFVVQLGLDR